MREARASLRYDISSNCAQRTGNPNWARIRLQANRSIRMLEKFACSSFAEPVRPVLERPRSGPIPEGREAVRLQHPAALFKNVEPVYFEVFPYVRGARRPADLQKVRLLCLAQTKVDAQIACRKVAAAGANLVDLRERRPRFGV